MTRVTDLLYKQQTEVMGALRMRHLMNPPRATLKEGKFVFEDSIPQDDPMKCLLASINIEIRNAEKGDGRLRAEDWECRAFDFRTATKETYGELAAGL